MRRNLYITLTAALVVGIIVAFFILHDAPERRTFAPDDVDRSTSTDYVEPLPLPTHNEAAPSSDGPLQLTEPAAEVELVTGPRISGVVMDEEGRPVPGIQVYAYWPLNDEFGDPFRISSGEWTDFFQAVSQGRTHSLWKSIRRRQTRTDRDGAYAFGGLPNTYIQLQAMSDEYELRADDKAQYAWRVLGLPSDVINWTATRIHHLRVDIEYPEGIARPGTVLVVCEVGERIRRSFDAGKLGEAKFLPGLKTFTAWNEDFGLLSDPVEFEVSPRGGTIKLWLKELPRLEISVQFTRAKLHTEFELLAQVPEPEGRKTSEGGMLMQAPLSDCPLAGVWARLDMPTGEYRVVLMCLEREIVRMTINYSGGRQKFVLTVPEPATADCCVVRTNASSPVGGETLGVRYQYDYSIGATILWTRTDGTWLIQAPPGQQPELATGLSVGHSAWGNLVVEGNVAPGASVDAKFQPPCTLHIPDAALSYNLARSLRPILRNRSGQNISLWIGASIVVQPGQWELCFESSGFPGRSTVSNFLTLKPGTTTTLKIPELVAVKFIFPPYEAQATLEFKGQMTANEPTWSSSRVVYLIPGEYTVEFKPEFGSAHSRTFTAAATMTVDFTR